MWTLRRLVALPAAERWLVIAAGVVLPVMRLGLWVLPFRTVRRAVALLDPRPRHRERVRPLAAERVAWAVTVASRYLPGTWSCLTQALAVQLLLQRHGHSATLRIGVAQANQRDLQAHAWVESGGRVVFGGQDLPRYTALPALK